MKTVRIIDWRQRSGPPTRWAANCFVDAGCRVVISYNWAETGGADLAYTPVPGLQKTNGIPLITSLEGYGAVSVLPGSKPSPNLKKTFENSDKVLLADPNMYLELKRCGINQNSIMMPNPAPDVEIFSKESTKFTVFCPQGVWWIKKPERIIDAAKIVGKEEPKIKFVMPVGSKVWRSPLDWLDADNVEFLPSLPYANMLEEYARADIVAPFSQVEILPFTVFEAFISGKPTIVDAIGMVQSVHRKHVGEMVKWFGCSSKVFNELWGSKYKSGEGDHYLHAGSTEELAELILALYNDEKRRLELGNRALEWVSNYSWTPKDRGKKILEGLD